MVAGFTVVAGIPSTSHADLTWVFDNSQAEVVVADTATTLYVERLDRDIPFTNFRYPQVAPSGDIAFITDDPFKFGWNDSLELHGAYLSPSSGVGLIPIVEIAKPLHPSLEQTPTYIRGLQTDGDGYVYQAYFGGGRYAIAHWDKENGTRLLTSPDPNSATYAPWVGYADISGELVLFNAHTAQGRNALFLHHLGKNETRVLLTLDTPIPLAHGRSFYRFSPQNWLDGARIVFRAAWEDDSYKAHAPHPDDDGSGSSRGIYGWEGVDFENPATTSPEALIQYLDGSVDVPLGNGEKFCYLASAPVSADLIAFSGGWSGRYGIHTLQNDTVQVVVDTHTEIPELFDGPFTHFVKWIAVLPGQVAFIASAENGAYQGIFLYEFASDTLHRLYDNRLPLEGKTIRSFEIGTNLLLDDQFATMVRFTDESSGIYLFRRANAGMSRL